MEPTGKRAASLRSTRSVSASTPTRGLAQAGRSHARAAGDIYQAQLTTVVHVRNVCSDDPTTTRWQPSGSQAGDNTSDNSGMLAGWHLTTVLTTVRATHGEHRWTS